MVRAKKVIAILLMAFSVIAIPGLPASAHTSLISSDPVAEGVEKEIPEDVTLIFASDLLNTLSGSNQISVIDPMHQQIASQAVVEGAKLTSVLHPTMKMDGTYNVAFRVVAQDGHVQDGSFRFYVNSSGDSHPSASENLASGIFNGSFTADGALVSGGGDPNARVAFKFKVDTTAQKFCYSMSGTLPASEITGIHVHAINTINMKPSDEIFLPIDSSYYGKTGSHCTRQPAIYLERLVTRPSAFIVMIHTIHFPEGAVEGKFQFVKQPVKSQFPSVVIWVVLAALLALAGGATVVLLPTIRTKRQK